MGKEGNNAGASLTMENQHGDRKMTMVDDVKKICVRLA